MHTVVFNSSPVALDKYYNYYNNYIMLLHSHMNTALCDSMLIFFKSMNHGIKCSGTV